MWNILYNIILKKEEYEDDDDDDESITSRSPYRGQMNKKIQGEPHQKSVESDI